MTILLNGYWSQKRRRREKKAISQIAKLLDRYRVTIYRDVKRGSVSQLKHDLTVYRASPKIEATSRRVLMALP